MITIPPWYILIHLFVCIICILRWLRWLSWDRDSLISVIRVLHFCQVRRGLFTRCKLKHWVKAAAELSLKKKKTIKTLKIPCDILGCEYKNPRESFGFDARAATSEVKRDHSALACWLFWTSGGCIARSPRKASQRRVRDLRWWWSRAREAR